MHELIGSGGFAEVFRATWTGSRRRKRDAGRAKQPRSLPREAHGLRLLLPRVRIDAAVEAPECPTAPRRDGLAFWHVAVRTAYMPRGSVFGMLHPRNGRGTPLPRVLAMRMLADCARGVGYLHGCSPPIIHRDLKSQNLLVGADYSVGRRLWPPAACLQPGAMTRTGRSNGPRQRSCSVRAIRTSATSWSFGVVCWEVLTARVPFDGMAPTTVATKVAMEGLRLPCRRRLQCGCSASSRAAGRRTRSSGHRLRRSSGAGRHRAH